ncbi:RNA cap guanine-N2 methyltransferase-domain-containing protein [Cladochytrium replicatum]|nr:RNA cap guanine-N2 methyltransferase-domain-containing protein [Cladochytrium replicatum]
MGKRKRAKKTEAGNDISDIKNGKEEHFYLDPHGKLQPLPQKLAKYWHQRFSLFSKFDEGIRIDEEGWYSVTPEKIAAHISERCKCDVIVDAFCGVGGNAIQFARTCNTVLAIDIDPQKIACARRNAELYGVSERIEFIVGDFFELAPSINADTVFLSPPWGGPSYNQQEWFGLDSMDVDGFELFKCARSISPNIAYFLPRNIDWYQLADLPNLDSSSSHSQLCEYEEMYLNDRLKCVTVYFGSLVEI